MVGEVHRTLDQIAFAVAVWLASLPSALPRLMLAQLELGTTFLVEAAAAWEDLELETKECYRL